MSWADLSEATADWSERDTQALQDESGNALIDESGNALVGGRVDAWTTQAEATDSWAAA